MQARIEEHPDFSKAAESAAKKKQQEAENAAKRAELLPSLTEVLAPFLSGAKPWTDFHQLTNTTLLNLIKYYYNERPTGLTGNWLPFCSSLRRKGSRKYCFTVCLHLFPFRLDNASCA